MRLPEEAIVCFQNTGKEDEATLVFVHECETRWNVKIHWIEYRNNEQGYTVVDYETASREGEPFEELIRKNNYLPSPVKRICTAQLKIRPQAKYMRDLIGPGTLPIQETTNAPMQLSNLASLIGSLGSVDNLTSLLGKITKDDGSKYTLNDLLNTLGFDRS